MKKKFTVMKSGAKKDLGGKSRPDLIPPEVIESLANVYALEQKNIQIVIGKKVYQIQYVMEPY